MVRQYLDRWNAGDHESMIDLIHEEFDYRPLPNNGWSPPGTNYYGREGWRSLIDHLGMRERSYRHKFEVQAAGRHVIASGPVWREEPDGTWTERFSALLFTVSGGRIIRLEGFATERDAMQALTRVTERGPQQGSLTLRQREIFRLLADGLNGPEIAERLGISPDTVRTHVANGMASLGAKTRAEAVATAVRQGDITL